MFTSKSRLELSLVAALALCAAAVAGCEDDPPPTSTTNNATNNGTNNGTNNTAECELSTDCLDTARNQRGSCQQGKCEYVCRVGYEDRDSSAGCEFQCQSAENVCNDVDDDCDGEVNEQPPLPNPPRGVCAEAEPYCDGARYINGGTELFGQLPAFRTSGLEDFLCDEIDNDCDGFVDDVCCRGTERPTPIELSAAADAKLPQVARAVQGGIVPNKAIFVTAWNETNETVTQLVQGNGWTVNSASRYANDAAYPLAQSMDMALDETTIFMALTGTDDPATISRVYLHEMKVGQAEVTTPVFDQADTSARNVSVAFSDTDVCLTWTFQGTDPTNPWGVMVACAPKDNAPALADAANQVVLPEAAAAEELHPVIAGGETGFVVGWVQPGATTQELFLVPHDGAAPESGVAAVALGTVHTSEPIGLLNIEETTQFVAAYPFVGAEHGVGVRLFDTASATVSTLSYPEPLRPGALSGLQVTTSDIDRDDTNDGVFVSWHSGTAIRGGARHLDQLAAGTAPDGAEVFGSQEGADIEGVAVAGARRILGTVFRKADTGVFFVSGSLQGAAVCVPDDVDY